MRSPPQTLQAARAHLYGAWPGRPGGNAYHASRCAYEVWGRGAGAHGRQCSRLLLPGYGPERLYCRQHARMLAAQTIREEKEAT